MDPIMETSVLDPILYEEELDEAWNIEMRLLLINNSIVVPGPLKTECWVWIDKRSPAGYGYVYISTPNSAGRGGYEQWERLPNGLGYKEFAHRLSWTVFKGEIPEGLFCLHKCDVKGCINPDHLYVGTQWDNVQDREARGLGPHGYRAPWRRL